MPGATIQNGTRSRVRVAKERPNDYTCPTREGGCGKVVRYFWLKCPNCNHPRPE